MKICHVCGIECDDSQEICLVCGADLTGEHDEAEETEKHAQNRKSSKIKENNRFLE